MLQVPARGSAGLRQQERVIEGELIGRLVLPRPIKRATQYAVAKQLGRGLVGVTRVQTTRRVVDEVLYALEDLEAEEAAAIARDPFNAGRRQRWVVDVFTAVGLDAIRTTGQAYG
ncbi:hypothetical protein JOD57_003608 [Geodermatophilus bullaregiensis]|uniref:hypothetical protein n=1 Tax=Geodermatophilus bullaregiensis TaxID=1564160 RepID=UPI00195BCB41|nr:hypothetical protein [Geodermatophilus bullaregiensis]MBM7807771.1 hypothetical protein [Geodermatophilus bullaregiensis]